MRYLPAVLLLALGVAPAFANRPVKVEQLDQFLTATRGRSDADVAWQIGDLQLTERLSAARLGDLEPLLPGEKSRQALRALADISAFQPPPPAETPHAAPPDLAEQRRIVALGVDYVLKVIPQLPNFIATRAVDRFEDTPHLARIDQPDIAYQPLHFVGNVRSTVAYAQGHEVETPLRIAGKKPQPEITGLTTRGVFGPILGLVLVDAAKSTLTWDRWEQNGDGLEAVFRFEVPKANSHYEVDYCCLTEQGAAVADVYRFRRITGYRGTLALDPATGTILRLSVEADLKASDPIIEAAILVEYGKVDIAGRAYICPMRSISLSRAELVQVDPVYKRPLANQIQPLRLSLNESIFSDYHVFRSEARILAGNLPNDVSSATGTPAPSAENAAASSPPQPAPSTDDNTVVAPAASAIAAAPVTAPSAALEPPEISMETGLPAVNDAIPAATVAALPGYTLHTVSRLVDVALVAYDKKGKPIVDLKPEDFTLLDNGRPQKISSFTQAASEDPSAAVPPYEAQPYESAATYSNRATPAAAGVVRGATVLLIDSSNLAFGDLGWAREEMQRFLKTAAPGEPVGLYVLRSFGFEVLLEPTLDHAAVSNRLARWMPNAQDLARAQDEEQRNRQSIEWVPRVSDLAYVNGNESIEPQSYASGENAIQAAAAPVDPKLRSMGSNPAGDALFVLNTLAHHLAALPGHKSLVWIASDNVLADWSNSAATREEKGARFIHGLSMQTEEALNEAHVSIYPLDASQLEPGVIGADIGTRNVQAVGKSERDQAYAALGDAASLQKPGRETARMKQDTHPIAPEFRALAEATGGRALRRAGDITAELNTIVEDGRAAYQLSFTPDTPADDQYHHITLQWAGKRQGTLRYRTGYLYAKEPETMRDRLRQAIWQPADAREIGITAVATLDASHPALKLHVAAADLALSEQGGRWMGKLDLLLATRDDAAVHAQVNSTTVVLRLRPDTYATGLRDGLAIDLPLPAAQNTGTIRVIVVDRATGHMGTVTVPANQLKQRL
jgi:VWFA-related protein